MKKLILVFSLLFLIAQLAYAGTTAINYGGTNGQISINTSAPGYNDSFSMNAGGSFSGYHHAEYYSLNRKAQFSGGGDIFAVTSASDMIVGIAIEGNTGYLGESIDVSSSLIVNFLVQASNGSGEFSLYAFAPYMDFGAEIWADSLYIDLYMSAYDARIGIHSTFDSYLEGCGSVASQ